MRSRRPRSPARRSSRAPRSRAAPRTPPLVTITQLGAVVDAGRVAGGRRSLGVEHRLELRELLERRVAARALVDLTPSTATISSPNRPPSCAADRALRASATPSVLLLAARCRARGRPWRPAPPCAACRRSREAVEDHRVDQLAVTQPVAEARLLQEVRRVGHRLHPARDDHLVIAGADHRVRDLDGADRRGADLVDRVRRVSFGSPAPIAAWRAGAWPAPPAAPGP